MSGMCYDKDEDEEVTCKNVISLNFISCNLTDGSIVGFYTTILMFFCCCCVVAASVPDSVKAELLQRIRSFLMSVSL